MWTTGSWSYNCQESGWICSENKFLSGKQIHLIIIGSNSWAVWSLSTCLSWESNSWQSCMKGYYAITDSENSISNWIFCTSNSQFQLDWSSWVNMNTDAFDPNLVWKMWQSSLVLDNSSCEMSCQRGSFISTSTSENKGIFDTNEWK